MKIVPGVSHLTDSQLTILIETSHNYQWVVLAKEELERRDANSSYRRSKKDVD